MTPVPPRLPPLAEWEDTKQTLHLWAQVVGKIRMASSPPRNHWWHVPLYVDVRGLTTRRLHAADGVSFEIDFDFLDHQLIVQTDEGRRESFALHDGLSVSEFDSSVHSALKSLGVDVPIREVPFGMAVKTPFPADVDDASYDAEIVQALWRVLEWSDGILEEFAGWYCGKTSPVHLFWHGFDLALTRFGGGRAPELPDADVVTQEAYSHEVISFGFWPGGENVPEPSFYSYTAPEPDGLRRQPLRPDTAFWADQGAGSLARLAYEDVRSAEDPRATLLAFFESAYRAGADTAGWDRSALTSSWCPGPEEIDGLLGKGRSSSHAVR
jgi:Family of unknown function (DUF5996)